MRLTNRFPVLSAFVLACCVAMMGASCSKLHDTNPILTGCTAAAGQSVSVELCAFSTYGTFTVVEEQGLILAKAFDAKATAAGTDPKVAEKLAKARDAIISADEKAKPVADNLDKALDKVIEIRAAIAAGTSTPEQLTIALTNLDKWVTEAGPLVSNLVNAVAGDATP